MSVGVLLLAFAAGGLWQRYSSTHGESGVPDAHAVVSDETAKPVETAPPADATYRVPADQPRSISLPDIGARGFVQKVGLTAKGAVVAPTNIAFAGWYAGSARPGDEGVALVDGHVQGQYNPGIFKRLAQLAAGSRFSVEFGDGSQRQFEVVRVDSYPVENAGKHMLQPVAGIARQLNLITCDGPYDAGKQQYANRALVVSRAL